RQTRHSHPVWKFWRRKTLLHNPHRLPKHWRMTVCATIRGNLPDGSLRARHFDISWLPVDSGDYCRRTRGQDSGVRSASSRPRLSAPRTLRYRNPPIVGKRHFRHKERLVISVTYNVASPLPALSLCLALRGPSSAISTLRRLL